MATAHDPERDAADKYYLGRSATESARLDTQHKIIIDAVGYTIHPAIRSRLPANAVVADVACGTGAFLLQLSDELPGTELHGFDISPAQFPTHHPPHVQFHTTDMKQPFSAEFHGKFDAVFLRALVSIMSDTDWALVASHVRQLLNPQSPCAAIQWVEGDWTQVPTILRTPATPPSLFNGLQGYNLTKSSRLAHGFTELVALLIPPAERSLTGALHLPTALAQAGFAPENVFQDVMSMDRDPALRDEATRNFVRAWAGMVGTLVKTGNDAAKRSVEDVERLAQEMMGEVDAGLYTRMDLYVTLGFLGGSGE